MTRRTFITTTTAAAMGFGASTPVTVRGQEEETVSSPKSHQVFWPEKARLVISISMQFETGAQPDRGAGSPFPSIDPKYPDLPVQKWYEYGFKEGIPRLLDLWDRVGIKVTSHMVGQAVEKHPELAKEIVQRGHEAALARWPRPRVRAGRSGGAASTRRATSSCCRVCSPSASSSSSRSRPAST